MPPKTKVSSVAAVSPEEISQLAANKRATLETVVGEMVGSTPAKAKEGKLLNKKYYRTVNIDLAQEKTVAEAPKKGEGKEDEGSSPDYKAILRGMGFNV